MKQRHWLNFIDGKWCDSDARFELLNPATNQSIGTIAKASVSDAAAALAAARRCADSRLLSSVRPAERVKWMTRIAQEIRVLADEGAHVLCAENGKTVPEALDEFLEAARYFEYYGGMADKIEGVSIPLGTIQWACHCKLSHGTSRSLSVPELSRRHWLRVMQS
jgi:aldehyde dehydrogenase (NAD+)